MMTVNVIACAILLIWACWACLNPNVNDGVLGKFIFGCVALAALSVILGNTTQGIKPSGPGTTLHCAIAALGLRHVFLKHCWPQVKQRIQNRILCATCPRRNKPQ
jgi:hypothetical protein